MPPLNPTNKRKRTGKEADARVCVQHLEGRKHQNKSGGKEGGGGGVPTRKYIGADSVASYADQVYYSVLRVTW
jgi:hypothetical protein